MTIPDDIALWLQDCLLNLNATDSSIAWFASGNIASAPDYTAARWQLSVDMLCRTISCDLLLVHNFIECSDASSFLQRIRAVCPFDDEGIFVWNGTLVYGSARLNEMIDAHFPSADQGCCDLNIAFIEALEQIFAQNDAPWSDKPLLPIVGASTDAASSAIH
jgi:hypothetical protein